MLIQAINESSPHLLSVKKLWRENSDTLGFFPEGAFDEHAERSQILVILDEDVFSGYLLYRVTRRCKATIAHLCVSTECQGRGFAKALVQHLVKITSHLNGIDLKCRRDFPVYSLWSKLGFAAVSESSGRASKGSECLASGCHTSMLVYSTCQAR